VLIDTAIGLALFRGLTRPAVRTWLAEP
jgi:hypothetical protein